MSDCRGCEYQDDCYFAYSNEFPNGTFYIENEDGVFEPFATVRNLDGLDWDDMAYKDEKEYDNMPENDKKSFGIDFNSSVIVDKDGKASVGIHYSDSEGNDFSRNADGDDVFKTFNTLLDGLTKEITSKSDKKKLEEKKARDAKRSELQKQLDDIQKQIDALDKVEKRSKSTIDDTFDEFDKEIDSFKNRYKRFFEDWPF